MKTYMSLRSILLLCLLSLFAVVKADYPVEANPYRSGIINPVVKPVYKNPAAPEFPILAWNAFPEKDFLTTERYRELREAGFNLALLQGDDNKVLQQGINAARKAYVKVILRNLSVKTALSMEENVKHFMNDPAVAGFYLTDGPSLQSFGEWRIMRDRIYRTDPRAFIYANLFPDTADEEQLGTDNYRNYLLDFVNQVDLPFISYGNYPVKEKDGTVYVDSRFFTNLEDAVSVASEKGIPFWAFCLSAAHDDYPVPVRSHILFEAFSALAYGAQGIQYHSYFPYGPEGFYRECPIGYDGRRSKVWQIVSNVNREIQNMRKVFLGARLKGVWHTGFEIPKGTRRLEEMPPHFDVVESAASGIVLSVLENNGQGYVVMVNKDILAKQKIKVKADKDVKRILTTGKEENFRKKSITLEPGGYAVFAVGALQ